MAGRSQTFSAVMKLQADNFKKGINEVKKGLKGLQNTFLGVSAALGAGLGLGQLINSLRKTATELSVAQATLENVSTVTKKVSTEFGEAEIRISNFSENMQFVKDLSNKYGQDIIALTNNFAKFHAAADTCNVSMEDQKMIYESLTKASAFFHMDSSRTADMMNAVTQMMSKGKVAAEELRRQLGNSLPGAFGLMAKAVGVSNQELESMMRKGQLLAGDVLPLLLNNLIP